MAVLIASSCSEGSFIYFNSEPRYAAPIVQRVKPGLIELGGGGGEGSLTNLITWLCSFSRLSAPLSL